MNRAKLLLSSTLLFVAGLALPIDAQEWKSGIEWEEPKVIDPGKNNTDPPSDAIVLFDGKDLSQWEGGNQWIIENGVAITKGGGITTKQHFGDMQLHVEWSAPTDIEGEGQGRGNSGVYIMGKYEVQILDSFENDTYYDGQAGSMYKQSPPMVNAMRKPGEWNVYDIIFTAPRFHDDGKVKMPAHITVLHNGVVIQNCFKLLGSTAWHKPPKYEPHPEKGPISLQFHGDAVKFRNIWVREIADVKGKKTREPYIIDHSASRAEETPGKLAGQVLIDGKPWSNAKLHLVRRGVAGDEGQLLELATDAHGKFRLEEGLHRGTYYVTVQKAGQGKLAQLSAKYADKSTTPLTVWIKPGENEVQLELKSGE